MHLVDGAFPPLISCIQVQYTDGITYNMSCSVNEHEETWVWLADCTYTAPALSIAGGGAVSNSASADTPIAPTELSAYEMDRAVRIADNTAFLKLHGLDPV